MIGAGRKVAPMLLFFGCRAPGQDNLYADELAKWQGMGAVDVRHAFSRAADKSCGAKYVQHRLSHDRGDVDALWQEGARIYVCGSKDVGQAVEEVLIDLIQEVAQRSGKNTSYEAAKAWFDKQKNDRYLTDVFD